MTDNNNNNSPEKVVQFRALDTLPVDWVSLDYHLLLFESVSYPSNSILLFLILQDKLRCSLDKTHSDSLSSLVIIGFNVLHKWR